MAIAIVSAGIRFPQARTLAEFWKHIVAARDLSAAASRGRWPVDASALKDSSREGRDAISHDRVYELGAWRESAEGLGVDAGLLEGLDPLFHICLGAGVDAWRQCQQQKLDKKRCAVILGNIALPTEASAQRAYAWLRRQAGDRFIQLAKEAQLPVNNFAASMPAQILASALGFQGPSFTLDAACASSLYAIKLACDALREGRLDLVLAGGLSRPDSLYTQVGFTALQALSRTGRCHALDHRADGLMVGEGAGLFALKRLEDAQAHGDKIWAVIRSVGLANDREGRLMAPSSEGQLRAMQAAYQEAGWDPSDVDFIECHATGTPLGDATEFHSLSELWKQAESPKKAVLGSVKPNVGHMLTAAGAAGLAKLIMAMHEAVLPPTANFEKVPADWQLEQSPFRILKSGEPWSLPATRSRRAALSGFGFGGINAHLLLEQYDPDRCLPERKSGSVNNAEDIVVVAISQVGGDHQERVCVTHPADHPADRVIASFDLLAQDLRIPPAELREVLPQQLLGLQAMIGLGTLPIPEIVLKQTACFVGIELDPMTNLYACRWAMEGDRPAGHRDADFIARQNALMPALNANRVIGSLGSIVASRIARELRLGGPSFTVSAGENSGLTALRMAFEQIQAGRIPAALVCAVDASGSHRGRAQWDEIFPEGRGPLDEKAVAWVLTTASQAREWGCPVHARLLDVQVEATAPGVSAKDRYGVARSFAALTDQLLASRQAPVFQGLPTQGQAHTVRFERGDLHPQSHPVLSAHTTRYRIERTDLDLSGTAKNSAKRASDARPAEGPMRELSPEPPSAAVRSSELRGPSSPQPNVGVHHGLYDQLVCAEQQRIESHESFLRYRIEGDEIFAQVLQALGDGGRWSHSADEARVSQEAPGVKADHRGQNREATGVSWVETPLSAAPALYDYAACQEFARGSIARVMGEAFAEVDQYPSRVRLPDERLLLCHRVMSIEGVAKSLQSGRMLTEHDVFPSAWYLEQERMPTAIAVESGQADLMLSAYLGADFVTKGRAVYRLLDARVAFHRGLPRVGETIQYDIQIKRFFEQSGTLFFHFAFEASIDGKALMSMQDGCAGFFTEEALAAGRGIKRSQMQLKEQEGRVRGGYRPLLEFAPLALSDAAVDALRQGLYAQAFGPAFEGLALQAPKGLPGGDMRLVHRIVGMEDQGGRFALGRIVGEADIHPDDWFLTCHFVDDQVMPGTLMYECCLHTLRILLMRKGWVGEAADLNFEPIQSVWSQLKCRGQVLADTQKVRYDIEIKEIGYQPEPYVICDALMSADGRDIVDITDMSLRLTGLNQEYFERLWAQREVPPEVRPAPGGNGGSSPAYSYEHILAFSSGRPSDCFGPHYRVFDQARRIARLPRPPFQFLDRVDWVDGPLMQQHLGSRLLSHFGLADEAWFWSAEGKQELALAILVEIALQPCGFMAAYMGSALLSDKDLSFRNLSGTAKFLRHVQRGGGELSVEVVTTKLSRTAEMIIQDYSFTVKQGADVVYEGDTSFGYFSAEALRQQVGLRSQKRWQQPACAIEQPYPDSPYLARAPLLMVDRLGRLEAPEGLYGLGVLFGSKVVDAKEWFFDAHFYQDPVMPGSLGLQALEQVLKAEALRLWPRSRGFRSLLDATHAWTYRGQVVPEAKQLHYAVHIKKIDEAAGVLMADAWLYCDDLPIYAFEDLALKAEH